MLSIKFEYSNKSFTLKPYNTKQEKDLLLMDTICTADLSMALCICGVSEEIVNNLTEQEKTAMLYKLREISVGSAINVKFTCSKCKTPNENNIDIEYIIKPGNIKNPKIKDCFEELSYDNIQNFYTENIDEMDIDEMDELYNEIKQSITTFDFLRPVKCQSCNHTNHIDIQSAEFCISTLSDDTLISLYQTYADLVFFGKYTLLDINTMYPFERGILINILNKTRDELSK